MKLAQITCFYFTVAFLTISASFVKAEDSISQFAFVFNSSRNPNLEEFSLYGSYRLNQNVKLLHISQNRICDAVTQRQVDFTDNMISFPVTVLRTTSKCDTPNQYGVAFFGKISEHRIVSLQTETNQQIINSLDKVIHDSAVLQSFNETMRGIVPYNNRFPLEFFMPKVYRFGISNKKNYLVSYEKDEKYPYGPKFVVLDEKPQILTGWCSYPYVRAFVLNQEFYFESGSGCCDCGITIMELFKIDANQVRLVHGDSSESD